MSIEWFPGHMLKARDAAADSMGRTDVVIEVLDARAPSASCNHMFDKLRQQASRPALKVLNKSDLADPERTKAWLAYYNALPKTRAIALSSKSAGEVGRIPKECLALAPDRGTLAKPLRMMILGIPNVGKSTLMNALLKRKVAKIGDEPGITRLPMKHLLKPGMTLMDTAGMLWPRIKPDVAEKLAAINSVGVAAYDEESVAAVLGTILVRDYAALLATRYGPLESGLDGLGVVAHVAKRRSFVMKGGVPDLTRAARMLLLDFRSGTLGAITLEVPGAET